MDFWRFVRFLEDMHSMMAKSPWNLQEFHGIPQDSAPLAPCSQAFKNNKSERAKGVIAKGVFLLRVSLES